MSKLFLCLFLALAALANATPVEERGFFRFQCYSTCQAASFASSTSCTFGGLFWRTTLTCAQIFPVLSANAAAAGCKFYGPSSTVPTSVHQLRPGDIGIIGSIGDSDTAAFGARASSLATITQEDRDISFTSGTSQDWQGQTSLANMIAQYNPGLVGGSTGTSDLLISEDYQPSQGLNYAVSGAWANTAGDQAAQLVEGIKQQVDWETKWKLITVQFGGNDICTTYCESDPSSEYYGDATPAGWRVNMDSVLSKLSSMTRTLVVFTESYMPSKLHNMVNPGWKCQLAVEYGCPCVTEGNMDEMTELRDDYSTELRSLAVKYRRSDFGVEVVPALTGLYPNASAGGPDPAFMAPDCFHFNTELHSMVGKNLWNNLVEPVGSRSSNYDVDNLAIKCPSEGQFISTTL